MEPMASETQWMEIHIAGRLDPDWAEWFDGFTIVHTDTGETRLTGRVRDQAELYGLIAKLRDLGAHLTSVNAVAQPRV